MRRIISVCIILLYLGIYQSTALADDDTESSVLLELRYFQPNLKDLTLRTGAIHFVDGDSVDFVRELGVDAKGGPEFRMTVNKRLHLDYMRMENSGKAIPVRDFNYNGETITAGATTYTDVKMTYAKLAYDFPWLDDGSSRAWFSADIKYVKFDGSVHAPFVATPNGPRDVYASKSYKAIMPTIGAGASLNLDERGRYVAMAEFSVMPVGKYGPSYDLDANLSYKPDSSFALVAGYRLIKIHAEDDPEVDFAVRGPYFGIHGTF